MSDVPGSQADVSDLLDWKRRVFELYRHVRLEPDTRRAWEVWRNGRDELFKNHPQSPLTDEARQGFQGLRYFDYVNSARVIAELAAAEPKNYDIATSGDSSMAFTRFAVARFEFGGQQLQLEAYWLSAYGGGVFLPVRDRTAGEHTYGAGRYVLDTVKGADLGGAGSRIVLDFNFAYNPSCAYDPRWVCPLAPPPNRLDVAIEAGELAPSDDSGGPPKRTPLRVVE